MTEMEDNNIENNNEISNMSDSQPKETKSYSNYQKPKSFGNNT